MLHEVLAQRPIYRHIVVQRKALVEHVPAEKLKRLRQQMEAGGPIDDDLRDLVVKDTLKKSVRKAMAWAGHGDVDIEGTDDEGGLSPGHAFNEATSMKERGDERRTLKYQTQEGVVVSHIIKDHMPGDRPDTPMPSNPIYLSHEGCGTSGNRQADYMRCAEELHAKFMAYSDRKFLLMDKELRAGLTLVTLCLTPIIAVPREDVGFELLCEFHQKTRFGHIDTDDFEVFSEIGEYPVQIPTDEDMMMMFMTKDEFLAAEAITRGQ